MTDTATVATTTGKTRSTGVAILLCIVTLGFYALYWYYAVHSDLKRQTGNGIGGGIALLLAIFVGIAMPFVTANEVAQTYAAKGQKAPVSAITGLWILLPLLGSLIWFVKVNGAINNLWRTA
jgi:hypothetical protein